MKNFQSHRDSNIEFHPGLNAIIGETNSGKTSILRGIELICENRPLGSEYIRNGESKSSNTIVFDDGFSITRERGKTENAYDLLSPDNENMHFEGFGTSVPDAIREAHGMTKIQIGDMKENINIAKQLDGPFLLKDSPQTRAYVIGFLAKTEITDDAIVQTNSDVRAKNSEFKSVSRDIDKNEEKLKEYENIEIIKVLIDEISESYECLKSSYDILESIKESKNILSKNIERKKIQEKVIQDLAHIDKISEDIVHLERLFKTYEDISVCYNKLGSQELRKEGLDNIIKKALDYDSILEQIESVTSLVNVFKSIEKTSVSLATSSAKESNLVKIIEENRHLEDISEEIQKCQNKLFEFKSISDIYTNKAHQESRLQKGKEFITKTREELDIDVKNYGVAISNIGKCPLCFSPANDEAVEKIKLELRG